MKILVTGPRGFVGARIVQALDAVSAPSLRDATEDDVRRLVEEVEPDAIVHIHNRSVFNVKNVVKFRKGQKINA